MSIQEGMSDLVVASFPSEPEARVIMHALADEPKPAQDLWIAREQRFRHLSSVSDEAFSRKTSAVDALFSMADVAAGGALIGLAVALLSVQFRWISPERVAFAVVTWVFGGIVLGGLLGGIRVLAGNKNARRLDSDDHRPETRFLLMATSPEDAARARRQLNSQLDATAYLG